MDLLIGLGLFLYCLGFSVYGFYSDGFSLDLKALLQILVSGVGSGIILLPILWGKIKNIDILNIIPDKEKEMELPECDDKVEMDTKCLHYLKHRAVEMGSEEAIEMVIKLNTLLFSDVCKKEKEDE